MPISPLRLKRVLNVTSCRSMRQHGIGPRFVCLRRSRLYGKSLLRMPISIAATVVVRSVWLTFWDCKSCRSKRNNRKSEVVPDIEALASEPTPSGSSCSEQNLADSSQHFSRLFHGLGLSWKVCRSPWALMAFDLDVGYVNNFTHSVPPVSKEMLFQ